MSAVEKIQHHIAQLKAERVAWIAEKPKVPPPTDATGFVSGLRAEYRWYRDQRARLAEARDALESMIEDCDLSMSEAQHAAGLMGEIAERVAKAEKYSDEAA